MSDTSIKWDALIDEVYSSTVDELTRLTLAEHRILLSGKNRAVILVKDPILPLQTTTALCRCETIRDIAERMSEAFGGEPDGWRDHIKKQSESIRGNWMEWRQPPAVSFRRKNMKARITGWTTD